jgi:hypothetical protein
MFKIGLQLIGAAMIWQLFRILMIGVLWLAIGLALATHSHACTGGCDQTTGVCFTANSQCGPAVWKWPPCPSLRRIMSKSDPTRLADAPTEMPGRHAAYCISGKGPPGLAVPSDTPSEQ